MESKLDKLSLYDLRVGDYVIMQNGDYYSKVKIDRLTKSMIFIKNHRFYKKDGYLVASKDLWYISKISIVSDVLLKKIDRQNTISNNKIVLSKISKIDPYSLTKIDFIKLKEVLFDYD